MTFTRVISKEKNDCKDANSLALKSADGNLASCLSEHNCIVVMVISMTKKKKKVEKKKNLTDLSVTPNTSVDPLLI